MEHKNELILLSSVIPISLLTIIFLAIFCLSRRKPETAGRHTESNLECKEGDGVLITEDLVKFEGGEGLSAVEILDAPGEVIGKSSYGTLYKAYLVHLNRQTLLRFLRPTCTLGIHEVMNVVELLGSIRHPNLVPLNAFYGGPRGEKLMVHPFYNCGNLATFIRVKNGNGEARKWHTIFRISIGIGRGVRHLHTALEKPIVHGNLKSKNILLDAEYHSYVTDFGLYLLLNPSIGQQILEASGFEGYRAPELMKMKDACEESDIYSLGIIFLELLSGKVPIDKNVTPDQYSYLPSATRTVTLDNRFKDLYRPDILLSLSNKKRVVTEDSILGYFQLAMACCSPTRLLRPNIKQIVGRLEEIGADIKA